MNKRLLAWFPTVLKYSGLLLVFFLAIFWAVTNRFNGELLAFLALMMGLSEGVSALRELGKEPPPELPKPKPRPKRPKPTPAPELEEDHT